MTVKNSKKINKKRRWELLPLQITIMLLPLMLYLYLGRSGYSIYAWNALNDTYLDVFLHGKMVVFQVVSVVVFGLSVYKLIKLNAEKRKRLIARFIPLFAYLGFVILSTICSTNMKFSFLGSMDAKEPFGVLAGYVLVAFYAYAIVDELSDLLQLMTAAVIGAFVMAVLGVLQAIGKDPLAVETVQRLFVNSDFMNMYGPLQLTFKAGHAYGTLYNPNYVGTYVAMYVPLLTIGLIFFKQVFRKVICGISVIGLLIMLFASQSRTGLIALAAVLLMLLVFAGRGMWKYWYLVIPGITLVVMVFSLVNTYNDNLLVNRLLAMFNVHKSEANVQGVDTTGDGVRVLYKDTEYKVMMQVSGSGYKYLAFEGEEQKKITYGTDGMDCSFALNNGDEIVIQTALFDELLAFGLDVNGMDFYFTNQSGDGNYKYINEVGRLDECIIPKNVLPGYEGVASGRGYVWGRTIPLLLDHIVIGSGPDTFTITFPQNDYVARNQSGFNNIIFTRPHNFYLQMGVQTGVLSLAAFLFFYLAYFVGSCRRYFLGKFNSAEEWMGFAIFLSTIGFIASGLANDSLIVVTPIFYVLIGMGMAINHKLCHVVKKEKKQKKTEEKKNSREGLE